MGCSDRSVVGCSDQSAPAITAGEPLSAIQDAVNLGNYDEIIISTLPSRMSRWLTLDLVSKTRALGLAMTHVEATTNGEASVGVGET